ncbi:MAG: cupin domain-containing protein [Rhizomicrobium sp.]
MARKPAGKTGPTKTTNRSPEGFFEPFAIDDVPWQKAGPGTFKRLGRYGGGVQVGVGIDVLKPGQYSNRFHYHLRDEEHIFVIRGAATLILGAREYVMKERDFCTFPAGQRAGHHLYNHTGENCLFMTIGDNRPDDIAVFPKFGNARLRATGKTIPMTGLDR